MLYRIMPRIYKCTQTQDSICAKYATTLPSLCGFSFSVPFLPSMSEAQTYKHSRSLLTLSVPSRQTPLMISRRTEPQPIHISQSQILGRQVKTGKSPPILLPTVSEERSIVVSVTEVAEFLKESGRGVYLNRRASALRKKANSSPLVSRVVRA